ncbi:12825_t:CDS:1, partial [Gigaspora margarita]
MGLRHTNQQDPANANATWVPYDEPFVNLRLTPAGTITSIEVKIATTNE